MKKIIFICTGNSCRSQMAHGLFREMCSEKFEVFSAGSHPSRVHPAAIKVMNEVEIDISHHTSDNIKIYMDKNLVRFSKGFAAAGHPNAIFGISFFELKKLTNAEVDDLTE